MNKEEAIEVMAQFLFDRNIRRTDAIPEITDESRQRIRSQEMMETYIDACDDLYDDMDAKGLIVKP